MRIHFPWHKIIECHCVKSYSNQIIRCIIKKLWHCLSVPRSLIKMSNLIWKHVAVLISGPISLDLSNVCGPDAEFGCSLHWSHNPPFKILEMLEVGAGGVWFSVICFKLKTAASLPLVMGLGQPLPGLSGRTRWALKKRFSSPKAMKFQNQNVRN